MDPVTKEMQKIKEVLITILNLEGSKDIIEYDTPLFSGELGLDSVDLVSAIVAIEKLYNIEFSENTDFEKSFYNVYSIAKTVNDLNNKNSNEK